MTDFPAKSFTIAIVGDIHHHWGVEDEIALNHLGVKLVLFVGDIGNEDVGIVRQIANLSIPKAVILGNHDAWFTATEWGRKKAPYDYRLEDRVAQQLMLLGEDHVGYSKKDFPELGVSVVGGRPFSWGGPQWLNPKFYFDRYQVQNFQESSELMVKQVELATCDTIIFLGHNGPYGLGDNPEDMCGKDWHPMGGDFGDSDFQDAIEKSRKFGKKIALVTFGHMHHHLRHRKDRIRTPFLKKDGTVYLNSACVPRIRDHDHQKQHNFSLVTFSEGEVINASLVWVDRDGQIIESYQWYNRE